MGPNSWVVKESKKIFVAFFNWVEMSEDVGQSRSRLRDVIPLTNCIEATEDFSNPFILPFLTYWPKAKKGFSPVISKDAMTYLAKLLLKSDAHNCDESMLHNQCNQEIF